MSPNPALVTKQAAQRLPRIPLLLLCAAYLLPGLFGRDPWRGADADAFGYMVAMAEGRTSWWAPVVAGWPLDGALLPHWLGAAFITLLRSWVDPALAVRLPFAALLAATLALTWYSCFHLARTDAAQPLPLAFGGEAQTVDYARAIADGALLALIASLGLLRLGHETTPELVQLFAATLLLWALSAAPFRRTRALCGVLVALPLMAVSGAPVMAVSVGLWAAATQARRQHADPALNGVWPWTLSATALAAIVAVLAGTWAWRWHAEASLAEVRQIGRLFLWFLWPAWVLAMWTVWRWRRQLLQRHLAVPLGFVALGSLGAIAMGGSDRALMLSLPALAVLAAFALPTLQRGTSAAIDWFSVFFFSLAALFVWVYYLAMQTGWPAKPAANIARLAPGFQPSFSMVALIAAGVGTAAWLMLVRWRTGRHRHPLWKSMVLPASGVALCWLLVMTLWLPPIDYARSYRTWVERLRPHLDTQACVAAPLLARGAAAALAHHGGFQVVGRDAFASDCPVLLLPAQQPPPPGWTLAARVQRPADRNDVTAVYRRSVR